MAKKYELEYQSMINSIDKFFEYPSLDGFRQDLTAHNVPLELFEKIYEYMINDKRLKKEALRFMSKKDDSIEQQVYFSTWFSGPGNKEITLFSVFDLDAKDKLYDLWLSSEKY